MKNVLIVTALFIGRHALAQDSTNNFLENVVITANKLEKKQSRTGKVVTVFDGRMLDALAGRTFGEVVNIAAGTTIIGSNSNLGTNQRMSIRGSADGNVLLLIDGVPANDPSVIANYFDLNFINLSSVEKIEILKGAQSTLYGSDAVAGVINVITRKSATRPSVNANATYGSYNTVDAGGGIRGKTGALSYNVSASFVGSRGFSAAFDSTNKKNFDNDGYKQHSLHSEIGVDVAKSLSVSFFGKYSRYKTDLDAAAFTDDRDFYGINKNTQAGFVTTWNQKNGRLRFAYNFNKTNRFYLDDSTDRGSFAYFSKSDYTGNTHYAELYETFRWKHIELLAGLDYRSSGTHQFYKSISSFGPFETALGDTANMNQWSPYASVVCNFNNFNVEFGTRMNHHSTYGDHFTYTVNPSYLLHEKVKVFANLASAFKTPSLFQLFDSYIGNKTLAPEKSVMLEAGLEIYAKSNMNIRLDGFVRKTNNAIQFIITDPIFFTGTYENINSQNTHGIEVEYKFVDEKWNVTANYSWTKGNITSLFSESGMPLSKDTSYNNLYRVPEHAVNAFASYNVSKKITLSGLLKYAGKRLEPIYASAPVPLKSYFVADFSCRYGISQHIKAFANLKNITNRQYFELLGYNTRRFNYNVGIRLEF